MSVVLESRIPARNGGLRMCALRMRLRICALGLAATSDAGGHTGGPRQDSRKKAAETTRLAPNVPFGTAATWRSIRRLRLQPCAVNDTRCAAVHYKQCHHKFAGPCAQRWCTALTTQHCSRRDNMMGDQHATCSFAGAELGSPRAEQWPIQTGAWAWLGYRACRSGCIKLGFKAKPRRPFVLATALLKMAL